jgi:hypothetical protein
MNIGTWRTIRNWAVIFAVVVFSVQMYVIWPLIANTFEDYQLLSKGIPPIAPNPEENSRLFTAMLFQPIALLLWIVAFVGWGKGRNVTVDHSAEDFPTTRTAGHWQ